MNYRRKYAPASFAIPVLFVIMALVIAGFAVNNSAEGAWPFFSVDYEGKQYHVVHLTSGGAVTNITAHYIAIEITLQSEQDGQVQLAVQKELLNATNIIYDSDGRVPVVFVGGTASKDYVTEPREDDIVSLFHLKKAQKKY